MTNWDSSSCSELNRLILLWYSISIKIGVRLTFILIARSLNFCGVIFLLLLRKIELRNRVCWCRFWLCFWWKVFWEENVVYRILWIHLEATTTIFIQKFVRFAMFLHYFLPSFWNMIVLFFWNHLLDLIIDLFCWGCTCRFTRYLLFSSRRKQCLWLRLCILRRLLLLLGSRCWRRIGREGLVGLELRSRSRWPFVRWSREHIRTRRTSWNYDKDWRFRVN